MCLTCDVCSKVTKQIAVLFSQHLVLLLSPVWLAGLFFPGLFLETIQSKSTKSNTHPQTPCATVKMWVGLNDFIQYKRAFCLLGSLANLTNCRFSLTWSYVSVRQEWTFWNGKNPEGYLLWLTTHLSGAGAVFPTGGIGGRLGRHSEGGAKNCAQQLDRVFFAPPSISPTNILT